ncbi:myotubularin-related protein 14 isoform X2 [Agrilus planipennis]|uniref:Myotubularin-related protein 14 isoform X2 n=1 Tax=Agrilus planipennis TaxID=224129 RepID=A0A1W4WR54_AGRPL|nr:myotubularin-related protein 14 isoform X2 [Agrilus planipennis]
MSGNCNLNMTNINPKDIQDLLNYFSKNTYHAKEDNSKSKEALERSIELMRKDYNLFLINNTYGELSSNYPSSLIILEYEREHNQNNIVNMGLQMSQRTTNTIYESIYDIPKLKDLINKARFARCRARFPLPVILYKGKYICRSATLSGGPEIYGRSGLDYLFCGSDSCDNTDSSSENNESSSSAPNVTQNQFDWQLFNKVRCQDIKLLKTFNVGTIIDFMVEKKKVKFGLNVTSSEKVDKENRYSEFTIISLPYPGCEFFREYRDNDYTAEGLVFNWDQTYVDANIGVPDDPILAQLKINWEKYKLWDLEQITQNYMKLILKYLQDSNSGILIHCISGWDRTPLFISMLRISLWADGVAHQSLDVHQIVYLTIAYDWMLFGHNLADRISKGEEIFLFCFYMLKHLSDDEFSIATSLSRHKRKADSAMSDRSVLRADSDTQLDGMLLDQESRGSNISLNSVCSSVSSKSQDQPLVWFNLPDESTNGNASFPPEMGTSIMWSPNPQKTSPVTVPAPTVPCLRQRQESSSSLSIGSWQMISGTGSLRGSDSNESGGGSAHFNRSDASLLQDSSCTIIDEDSGTLSANEIHSMRKERLLKVRAIFYHCYCSTIGFKFKNGDSSLSSLLGNIVEKVGLTQRL